MAGGRSILLVEDHAESRASLAYVLEKRGEVVHQASNGRSALTVARRERLQALILDLKLPDMDGLSVLEAVLAEAPGLPAIVVTGFGTIDSAVEAMKRGAADFLTKPIQVDSLLSILDRCMERAGASGAVSTPPTVAAAEMQKLGIVGESRAMQELFDALKRAELFGHERGAFTSADRAKPGVMETAHGGTLFLDELNEMGLGCQAKLLRAIERREFRRVGGTRKIKVNLRVVAASNVNLEDCVATGRFRPDLYYRLKVLSLEVPSLRDRKEAIPVLAQRFLDDVTAKAHMPARRLTPEAVAQLGRYGWPGNVRELRNVMESVALMGPKAMIDVKDLPANVRKIGEGAIHITVGTTLDAAERDIIQRTLDSYPTVKESARVLGIGLRTLHSKIRRYGLRGRHS